LIVAIASSIALKLFGDSIGWPLSLPIYIVGVFVFLVGILVGLTIVPDARKLRLIVCETGMLQVTGAYGHTRVRIMYWKDIQTIQPLLNEYHIKDGRNRPIVISAFIYQNGDELLVFIRERIAEVGR